MGKLLQVERPPVINVIAGVMQGMSNVAQAFVEQAAAPLIETVVPVEDVLTVMDDADAVGMSVLDSFAPLEEALESAFEVRESQDTRLGAPRIVARPFAPSPVCCSNDYR